MKNIFVCEKCLKGGERQNSTLNFIKMSNKLCKHFLNISFHAFTKYGPNPASFFVSFCLFLITMTNMVEKTINWKSIDGVLGLRTRDRKMEGVFTKVFLHDTASQVKYYRDQSTGCANIVITKLYFPLRVNAFSRTGSRLTNKYVCFNIQLRIELHLQSIAKHQRGKIKFMKSTSVYGDPL